MTRLFLAAGLLATLAAPALADDPRLVTRPYAEREVVRIDGRPGVQAAIAFAEDEHIENVAIGDAAKWQVTPNKRANVLFVKPLAGDARTNLTVMTDSRRYFFDLVASPGARPLYVLQFTYPAEKKAETGGTSAALAAAPALTETERAAIDTAPADPARLNFAWVTSGKAALLPARVYDDGEATFLSWPQGNAVPAILVRDETGREGPVNFAVRGDTIVVDGVPSAIYLRSGKAAAVLENRGIRPPAKGAAVAAATDAPATLSGGQ